MGEIQRKCRTSVVIAGAGPTGLSMAVQLLRYDIDFIIIERNEATTILSKAVVQARSLEIFRQVGLAKTALQTGRLTTAFNIFNNGELKVRADIAGLGEGTSEFPFVLSLEQSKTEKLLADYLQSKEKTILWKTEFVRYEENSDGVAVHYKDADGIESVVQASYIVGCDGAHSAVRNQMGQAFEGDTDPKIFYVADTVLSSSVINKDELFGFTIDKGFILFFPMESVGHYRVIGILPDKKEEDADFTFADIEQYIKDKVAVPVSFEEIKWFATYKVHSRMAAAFMKGRAFIAGDAAHIHTPAGGQGMNTGIQDSYNLAWKIAGVLNGKLNASVLETYNTERVQNAKHLLNTTDKMFEIMAGTNRLRNFIRLQIVPRVAKLVLKNSLLGKIVFQLIPQIGTAS